MPLSCQVQKLVITPLGILGREIGKHPSFPDLTRDHIVSGVVTVVNKAITQPCTFCSLGLGETERNREWVLKKYLPKHRFGCERTLPSFSSFSSLAVRGESLDS